MNSSGIAWEFPEFSIQDFETKKNIPYHVTLYISLFISLNQFLMLSKALKPLESIEENVYQKCCKSYLEQILQYKYLKRKKNLSRIFVVHKKVHVNIPQ